MYLRHCNGGQHLGSFGSQISAYWMQGHKFTMLVSQSSMDKGSVVTTQLVIRDSITASALTRYGIDNCTWAPGAMFSHQHVRVELFEMQEDGTAVHLYWEGNVSINETNPLFVRYWQLDNWRCINFLDKLQSRNHPCNWRVNMSLLRWCHNLRAFQTCQQWR